MVVVTDTERLDNLAANVKRLMLKNGLSQPKLAVISGVPQMTISRVLNARNDPAICVVSRLAEALDTSVDKLIGPPPKEKLQRAS